MYYEFLHEIADLRGKVYDLEKECLKLMSTNARLREAMESIAIGGCECCTEGSLSREEMIDEARSALNEGKEEK